MSMGNENETESPLFAPNVKLIFIGMLVFIKTVNITFVLGVLIVTRKLKKMRKINIFSEKKIIHLIMLVKVQEIKKLVTSDAVYKSDLQKLYPATKLPYYLQLSVKICKSL